jgi:hypothetical protein
MLVRPNCDIEAVFTSARAPFAATEGPAVLSFVGGVCAVAAGIHGRTLVTPLVRRCR